MLRHALTVLVVIIGLPACAEQRGERAVATGASDPGDGWQETFSYTGAMQRFIVPPETDFVRVAVSSAQGGPPATGGRGACFTGTVPVTGGQIMDIQVGGAGTTLGTGAWYGGGVGNRDFQRGGGGGGASMISNGGTPCSSWPPEVVEPAPAARRRPRRAGARAARAVRPVTRGATAYRHPAAERVAVAVRSQHPVAAVRRATGTLAYLVRPGVQDVEAPVVMELAHPPRRLAARAPVAAAAKDSPVAAAGGGAGSLLGSAGGGGGGGGASYSAAAAQGLWLKGVRAGDGLVIVASASADQLPCVQPQSLER